MYSEFVTFEELADFYLKCEKECDHFMEMVRATRESQKRCKEKLKFLMLKNISDDKKSIKKVYRDYLFLARPYIHDEDEYCGGLRISMPDWSTLEIEKLD